LDDEFALVQPLLLYAWRNRGLWEQIVSVLVMAVREAEGRDVAPTVVIVDSRSIKTTEAGGLKGDDAGKSAPRRRASSMEEGSIRRVVD
jgi:hypothetical protein